MRERVTKRPAGLLDRVGQWCDRAVAALSPERGARRLLARSRITRGAQLAERQRNIRQSTGGFEGAQSDQTRGNAWLTSKLSIDSALEIDLEEARDRSRSIYRNDSLGGAVDSRCNLVVSYGFRPKAKIEPLAGYVSEEQAKKYGDQLLGIYNRLSPRIGLAGVDAPESLWQLLRLCEKHHGFDGESFTIMSDEVAPDRRKPIPLTLQVIDPQRVETPPQHIGNPRIRMGIEYDDQMRIVAYWVRQTHPHDTVAVSEKFDRIPAERMLHVFEKWFAGQSRGLPWMIRTLNRQKDVKDFDEATLIAAQIEACYAGFVESPAGAIAAALGAADDELSNGNRIEQLSPGAIRYLDPGEKISFGAPVRPGSNYQPFMEVQERRNAAGMNFSYEMIAKNWGGLSFAAGRLSLTEVRLLVMSQQMLLTERWLAKVWERMVLESVIFGVVDIPPRQYFERPWIFEGHKWTPPAWPFALTPGEEIDAKVTAIDNNLMTKEEAVGEFGEDWEEVAEQRRKERELERKNKIDPPAVQKAAPPPDQPPQRKAA